jgi:hypothetical protein
MVFICFNFKLTLIQLVLMMWLMINNNICILILFHWCFPRRWWCWIIKKFHEIPHNVHKNNNCLCIFEWVGMIICRMWKWCMICFCFIMNNLASCIGSLCSKVQYTYLLFIVVCYKIILALYKIQVKRKWMWTAAWIIVKDRLRVSIIFGIVII